MQADKAYLAQRQAKQRALSKAAGVRGKLKADRLRTAQAYGYGGAITSAALQDAFRGTGAPVRQSSPSADRLVRIKPADAMGRRAGAFDTPVARYDVPGPRTGYSKVIGRRG